MPLYDYRCKECGETFEVRATIKEKIAGLNIFCPKCQSQETQQLLTTAMMVHAGKEIYPSGCGPNSGPGCCG
jgi:putative FmdB family regulatory protein